MQSWIKLLFFSAIVAMVANSAQAQDTGAMSDGNWNDPSIWTSGSPPGVSNDVYIGSYTPSGSATTATVALTQDESSNNVYVGNGSSSSGVLNLGAHHLTIADALYIGPQGGAGTLIESAGGSFAASRLLIGPGNSFTFGANDQVATLQLTTGAIATTTSATNVTGGGLIDLGSTLNLGADASWSDTVKVLGTGTTLNMNGHAITVDRLELGDYQPVTLNRGGAGGTITANYLVVNNTGGDAFDLGATDHVTNFLLYNVPSTLHSNVSYLELEQGSVAATTAAGNVTSQVQLYSGSTLNLGVDMHLSGAVAVDEAGSTLNLHGHALSAQQISLGWFNGSAVTLNRGGPGGTLTANWLSVAHCTFDLPATDTVKNFALSDATSTLHSTVSYLQLGAASQATTTPEGNVTYYIDMVGGSTLNLGADMNLSFAFSARDAGTTVNLNGHALSAEYMTLGSALGGAITLNRGGPDGTLHATNLYVVQDSFDLLATDSVTNYYLTNASTTLHSSVSSLHLENGSAAATTSVSNIASSVEVFTGSVLNLGDDLQLSGTLNVRDLGSSINANGHDLTASLLMLGSDGADPVTVDNVGALNAYSVNLDHGSSLVVHGGVINFVSLQNESMLTVVETAGEGLTLNNPYMGSQWNDPSYLSLMFNSTGWGFRWQNSFEAGNRISMLEAMIAAQQIRLNSSVDGTFSVYDLDGYTYVGFQAVPEPSSLSLAGLAVIVMLGRACQRRQR